MAAGSSSMRRKGGLLKLAGARVRTECDVGEQRQRELGLLVAHVAMRARNSELPKLPRGLTLARLFFSPSQVDERKGKKGHDGERDGSAASRDESLLCTSREIVVDENYPAFLYTLRWP